MILDALWRLRRRFLAAAREAPAGPLGDYYAAGMADLGAHDADLVAIDLETDGLDAKSHAIIEIGCVGMTPFAIDLSTALRLRLRPPSALRGESVVVHRITDDALALAAEEPEALARLLPCLARRVIVAHFARIEMAFLDAACRRAFGAPFVAPFICTFQLEERWFPAARKSDDLRLGNLRAAYGLPDYTAHDGLIDALACGEVLLAQRARKDNPGLPVADMLRR